MYSITYREWTLVYIMKGNEMTPRHYKTLDGHDTEMSRKY